MTEFDQVDETVEACRYCLRLPRGTDPARFEVWCCEARRCWAAAGAHQQTCHRCASGVVCPAHRRLVAAAEAAELFRRRPERPGPPPLEWLCPRCSAPTIPPDESGDTCIDCAARDARADYEARIARANAEADAAIRGDGGDR